MWEDGRRRLSRRQAITDTQQESQCLAVIAQLSTEVSGKEVDVRSVVQEVQISARLRWKEGRGG